MIVMWLMKVVVSVTYCRPTLATSADAYFDCHFRDNPDLSRSWLLPVIRDNVSDTELSFFASFFLPLAARFRQKGLSGIGFVS